MKLTFTNGFSKQNNPDELEINIQGKCQITNYDPREKNPEKRGDLTVIINGEESALIQNGAVVQENSKTVNLNSKKFSIFNEIANFDGDSSTLTKDDIEAAWKSYKKQDEKWTTLFEAGVTEIKYDSKAGVATFVIGKKELLRIDFQTWRERWGLQDDSRKISLQDTKENNAKIPKKSEYLPYESFTEALSIRESSGKVNKKNKYGYIGLFQIGEQSLADLDIYYKKSKKYNNDWKGVFKKNKYGITCLSDFRNSREKQQMVLTDLLVKNWNYIHNFSLDRYIGKTINGQKITESGLLAGAHLVGVGGLKKYLESEGKTDVKDKNNVSISKYVSEFANYDMSNITGTLPGTIRPEIVYENVQYTIKPGDTLSKIAKQFNTTVNRIKQANNLTDDSLSVNTLIIVPQGKEL